MPLLETPEVKEYVLNKQARKGFRPVSARWVFYGFSIKTAFIGISFVCTARYGFQH